MSDLYTWDYSQPHFDAQKQKWYWDGWRNDTGKKVKRWAKDEGQSGQAAQYDPDNYAASTQYQSTPRHDTGSLEIGMQDLSLQQTVESYGTSAPSYTTVQTGGQNQGTSTYDGDSGHDWNRAEATSPQISSDPLGYEQQHIDTQAPGPASESENLANLANLASYAYQGQAGDPGASYGDPGDSSSQYHDKEEGSHVTTTYTGQPIYDYDSQSRIRSNQYGQPTEAGAVAVAGGSHGFSDHYGSLPYGQSPSSVAEDGLSRRRKGKGKSKADVEVNSHNIGNVAQSFDYGASSRSVSSKDIPDNAGRAGNNGDNDDDDTFLLDGIQASRGKYGYGGTGEPSALAGGPAYQLASTDEPTSIPRSSKFHGSRISGTQGTHEALDKRYRIEHSARFEPGEVFKVMWYEPKGAPTGGGSVITERVALADHMKNAWYGFRRFIVIKNDEGHCNCIPILTYGGQGCGKNGVKPRQHGIVHEENTTVKVLPGEPPLGFAPIRMQMTASNEHISVQSRVNYAKLVTVEHNVKVFFVGRISYEDWSIVQDAVDKCWRDKTGHRSERSSHHRSGRSKR